MRRRICLLFILTMPLPANSDGIITFGPMVNLHLGSKWSLSYTLEAAYWPLNHLHFDSEAGNSFPYLPYSIDLGVEWGKGFTAIYSELQIGMGTMGISSGPCLLKTSEGFDFLPQLTVWTNLYMGAAYRWRYLSSSTSPHYATMYIKGLFTEGLQWVD